MSITDMIKKSVLEGFQGGDLTTTSILVTLAMAVAAGLYIYMIYRTDTKSGVYNRSFNKTLAALPAITAGIMLAMQSNLLISLGMVGALSIVRFRNAVKDPSDLMYLFWSISLGIVLGTGLFELALLISLCITALIFLLDLIPAVRASSLLVVSGSREAREDELISAVKKYGTKVTVRSRNVTAKGKEWILELRAKEEEKLVEDTMNVPGVLSANLLTHDGDVRF